MKKFYLILVLVTVLGFSQERKEKSVKQNLFLSIETQAGLNLIDILKKKTNDYEPKILEKTYFSYGFTGLLGYHFVPRFSVSGGVKYQYITDNIHPIYFTVQPRVYFNVDDESPLFFGIYYGNKINETTVKKAQVYGINLGQMNPIHEKMNFTGNLFIENHFLDGNGNWFVGINLGLTLFTGKNYY